VPTIVIRRANACVVTLLLMSAAAVYSPALALASTGGAAPQGALPATAGAPVASGAGTVRASGNGITIQTRDATLLRNRMTVVGRVPASAAGRTVEIQRLGAQTRWRWAATTHATVRADGSFSAVWPANHIGQFVLRAVLSATQAVHAAAASPTITVIVYRPSVATIYGPGFWGSRTACGQTLTRRTLGVANRTLPCGTKVAILYHGRTITVPVIDRGPYANHADWDLTVAAAKALGTYTAGVATIGAVSLPSH
jgi:peptidoglycan lytic transglycosylase